ncbi:MAG: HAD family phosphatase [Actinomycetota bacterium]|nr:MAG: HAD family phosphatase [Actinomycetota bacterium]
MDGLLVETESLWLAGETRTMAAYGLPWTPADQARCLGGPLHRVGAYMADRIGGAAAATDLVADLVGHMTALLSDRPVQWQPGARRLLEELQDAGVPCALASASPRVLVDAVLADLGTGWFGATVSSDDVERTKPHPEPYQRAATELGVEPADCVVLEDSPTGVAAGLAAGAYVVAVPHLVAIPAGPRTRVVASLRDVTLDQLSAWALAAAA